MRSRRWSPRWMAARASTIVSELISRTNELTDVNGMSYRLCGVGPDTARWRYRMYVEISAPNSMHSEPRNAHIATFSLETPVAVASIQRGDERRLRVWLCTTALLGSVFIGGQIYEFTSFVRRGMTIKTNVTSGAFYVLTGFHGVHVTLGILMLLSLVSMSIRGRIPQARAEVIEIAGLYWHFVDIVWIIIFTVVYLIP